LTPHHFPTRWILANIAALGLNPRNLQCHIAEAKSATNIKTKTSAATTFPSAERTRSAVEAPWFGSFGSVIVFGAGVAAGVGASVAVGVGSFGA
jgi:hypothetical protein